MKESFLSVCNLHAPLKRERVRARQAPWISSELKKLIFERDKLKKIPKRTGLTTKLLEIKLIT